MKAGALVLAVVLTAPGAAAALAASASGDDGSAWTKEIAFLYEATPDGAYPEGHGFTRMPEDDSSVPWAVDGYWVPVAWAFPRDPRAETGRDVAWTSAGQEVRFTRPDGSWTDVVVRDDRTYVVDTSAGEHAEYGSEEAPLNFTAADFATCTKRADDGACVRFADDHLFRSPTFLAEAPGRYTLALTIVDAAGAARVHTTAFDVVGRVASAPRDLVALPQADGGPYLSWAVPEDSGGYDVLYYAVYRDDGTGPVPVAYVASTSFRDGKVPDGTYAYTVTAWNAAGEGAASAAAVATVVDPDAEARLALRVLGEDHDVEVGV